ncbi:MAG: TlpA family protein disulfide reductase [Phycisphaerales bacterium JB063]
MPRFFLSAPLLCGLLAASMPAPARQAAPADPDGLSLTDRVIQAHRDLPRVHLSVRYTLYFSFPEETELVTTEYRVWFDRDAKLLRIERPGFTLVCDGFTVFLTSDAVPGRHLEAPLDEDLTYDALVALVPDVDDPVPPALTLLLADEPIAWLSGGAAVTADTLKPRDDDPAARPRFRLPARLGEMTVSATPGTLLLEDVVQIADRQQLQGSGLDDARWHHHYRYEMPDEPFAPDLFTLETEPGSQAVETMAQLLAPPSNPGNNGGGGPTLLGRSLPEIMLDPLGDGDPVDLSELEGDLVILEFFATWTRPSLTDLGDLQAYRDWAEEEGHDVGVYTVAVLEKSKDVRAFFERLTELTGIEYDLPVLMDVTGEAAIELGLPALPRTVVMRDGEIIDVLGGRKPEFLQLLQDRTAGWLGLPEDAVEGE